MFLLLFIFFNISSSEACGAMILQVLWRQRFVLGIFFFSPSVLELSTFDFKEESSGRYGSFVNSAGSSPWSCDG